LPSEVIFADGRPDLPQRFERFALWVKRFPSSANESPTSEGRFHNALLIDLGDRWKRDDLPPLLFQDMADQIILMQALHDDDNHTLGFIIEARVECPVEPFVDSQAPTLRQRVAGLQRIVDDDQIRAATGENAPDRCRQSKSTLGRNEFLQGRPRRG
jgi:hypothetical protein